ncbi:MAG: F0F1 ATP synthase subunit beta [Candidatus Makaraimicrobium thalassicum]|nr:MAG: F0F1 ATP synthase subunit beta [Candidatus Omnitrophota bacterium]
MRYMKKTDNTVKKGRVIAVKGPVVDVSFQGADKIPSVYEVIKARTVDGREVIMEVIEQMENMVVRCVCLTLNIGLRRNSETVALGSVITMPDSEDCYGRLMNVFGEPLDGRGPVGGTRKRVPIRRPGTRSKNEVILGRKREYRIIETGLKMLDLLFPFVVGSKTGILGGAALGKSILTLEIIHNVVRKRGAACVFTGAGERIREGNELYLEMKKSGILDRVALVFGQMNESPGVRHEVVFSGITVAESMQEKGEDVIFFLDNVFRFTQAGAELSALMGRIPSETGYQPTLVSEVSEFHERIRSSAASSITAVEAVYVPADDLTDPAVVTIFSHLDSIIVLSREYVQRGLYPAIDPILSSSAYLDPAIVGERHFKIASEIRKVFQKFEELHKLVAVVGTHELSRQERVLYERALKLQNFLTQPFFVAEEYTGRKGRFVELEDTLNGCEGIISGRFDRAPAEKFYMIGEIE